MRRHIKSIAAILFVAGIGLLISGSSQDTASVQNSGQDSTSVTPSTSASGVSVMSIEGTIGPTTTNYLERALAIAIERGDESLIVLMDTPGGLLNSTQEIVQIMLGSTLPITVYVYPQGANAGSAGTFITLAAHVAAMAPATNIGAASPVSMDGAAMDSVMQQKIFNYSESFIQSIAERRDRNAEWAISAVRDGDSITSAEALEMNVIDLMADDLENLLEQMDGMDVDGTILNTRNAEINRIDTNLAENFFSFILMPEVMLILTMIAIYGIVGEVTNPGAIIPGVSGVIALILLLYGVAALPINVAGFVLIILAVILFIIEAFTPTYGVLLTGGAVSFFLGALMLFQDFPQQMQLSLYWLIPATLFTVLVFGWIITYAIRSQLEPHHSGLESLVGERVKVIDTVSEQDGRVLISGEYWNAVSNTTIEEGDMCEIVEFQGLKVIVKPINQT